MKGIKEWFPLYAGDWITSIKLRRCSLAAQGVLINLMCLSWEQGNPGVITDSEEDLAFFLRITTEELQQGINELVRYKRIQVADSGQITIAKLCSIANEQLDKYQQYVSAGRKGGKASKVSEGQATLKRPLNEGQATLKRCLSSPQAIEEKRREENRREEIKPPDEAEAPPPDLNIGTYKQVLLLMWADIEAAAPRRVTGNEKRRIVAVCSRILKDIVTNDPNADPKKAFIAVWKQAMKHESADKWLQRPEWFEKDYGQFLSKKPKESNPNVCLFVENEKGREVSIPFKSKAKREEYIKNHNLEVAKGVGLNAVYK